MRMDEGGGQRLDKGISPARVETNWIQQQGGRALIPCVGSSQVETETDRNWSRD